MLHFQQSASNAAAGVAPCCARVPLCRPQSPPFVLARTMQGTSAGETRMSLSKSRFRAAAKAWCLALSLLFVLATSSAVAGFSPVQVRDRNAPGAVGCRCCQPSILTVGLTATACSCCDASAPADSVPSAAELGGSHRIKGHAPNQIHGRALGLGPRSRQAGVEARDRSGTRASSTHTYVLLCSFLI